jgi:hypothetical protein
MFMFTGAYILYSLTKNKHISLTIRDNGLVIDTRLWPRETFSGFVVEVDSTTHDYHNIILIHEKKEVIIYSFDDTEDNKKAFVSQLQDHLTLEEKAPLTAMDVWSRRLKL